MASTRSLAIAAALVCLVMVFALPATAKSPHHHHKRHKHHDHDHDHHHEDDYEKQPACQAKQTCVPTIYQYDNLGAVPPAPIDLWPKCEGPFVLCSVANCSIIAGSGTPKIPLQAECGCLAPVRDAGAYGQSLVTPNIIKSQSVYNATIQKCFNGVDPATPGAVSTCNETNSAPVCKAINEDTIYGGYWPLISTFTAYADQGVQVCTGAPDGSSIVADCMTAACYKKTAFDGSPYVCYCPVYSVAPGSVYAIGYPRSKFGGAGIPCNQPQGYVISGA